MEVFVAKFDYEKERDDILSFSEGDLFRITSKADKKWWAAYSINRPGEYGYVPSSYLEAYVDSGAGEQAQAQIESAEGLRKIATMQELKRKIPPTPASASNAACGSSSSSDSEENREDPVIIKPLASVAQPPEDYAESQIEPKRLANPHKESKMHVQLNKEIRLNHARGGIQNLGKPELERVMQRRRPNAEGRAGPIKAGKSTSSGSDTTPELASQLARRTLLLDEAERQEEEEDEKPDFMKVALRKTPQQR